MGELRGFQLLASGVTVEGYTRGFQLNSIGYTQVYYPSGTSYASQLLVTPAACTSFTCQLYAISSPIGYASQFCVLSSVSPVDTGFASNMVITCAAADISGQYYASQLCFSGEVYRGPETITSISERYTSDGIQGMEIKWIDMTEAASDNGFEVHRSSLSLSHNEWTDAVISGSEWAGVMVYSDRATGTTDKQVGYTWIMESGEFEHEIDMSGTSSGDYVELSLIYDIHYSYQPTIYIDWGSGYDSGVYLHHGPNIGSTYPESTRVNYYTSGQMEVDDGAITIKVSGIPSGYLLTEYPPLCYTHGDFVTIASGILNTSYFDKSGTIIDKYEIYECE